LVATASGLIRFPADVSEAAAFTAAAGRFLKSVSSSVVVEALFSACRAAGGIGLFLGVLFFAAFAFAVALLAIVPFVGCCQCFGDGVGVVLFVLFLLFLILTVIQQF
jgi:hypothetical protein